MNLNECPCSGKTLARLIQPAVMAVLADEPLHGYVLVQRLTGMAMFRDHGPDITGVYRLLKGMEKKGLVTSTWELAASGPAKRRYALTPDGRACLGRWITTLRTYREAVGDLLDLASSKRESPVKSGGVGRAGRPSRPGATSPGSSRVLLAMSGIGGQRSARRTR